MTQKKYTEIPRRFKSIASDDPYVAGAEDIEATEGKTQKQLNEETDERIATEVGRAEQAESTLDGKIAAEKTRAEGVEGGLNTRLQTVEQLAEISVGGGDIGIGTAADFESDDPEDMAKVPTIGAVLGGANDGVYDISARHNGTKYADLAEALGIDGANVPVGVRKGGMSVKFVQSSDNKYVQYRLIKNQFSADIENWQNEDNKPIVNQNVLLVGRGTTVRVKELTDIVKSHSYRFYIPDINISGLSLTDNADVFSILQGNSTWLFSLHKKDIDDGNVPAYVDITPSESNPENIQVRLISVEGFETVVSYFDIETTLNGAFVKIGKVNDRIYHTACFNNGASPSFTFGSQASFNNISVTMPDSTMLIYQFGKIRTVETSSSNTYTLENSNALVLRSDDTLKKIALNAIKDDDVLLLGCEVTKVSGALALYVYTKKHFDNVSSITTLERAWKKSKFLFSYFTGAAKPTFYIAPSDSAKKIVLTMPASTVLRIYSIDGTIPLQVEINANNNQHTIPIGSYLIYKNNSFSVVDFRTATTEADFILLSYDASGVIDGLLSPYYFDWRSSDNSQDNIINRNKDKVANIYAGADAWRGYSPLKKNFALLMFTDLHADTDRLNNALYLLDNCDAIDAGIFLGDMEEASASGSYIPNIAVPAFNAAQKDILAVLGNHDQRCYPNETITTEASTSRFMGALTKVSGNYQTRGYGYKDFADYKIRVIMLNPYDYPDDKDANDKCIIWGSIPMYQQAQITWFINTLNSVPDGYTVIVASHYTERFSPDNSVVPTHPNTSRVVPLSTGDNGYQDGSVISDIINAYKNKTTLVHSYNYITRTEVYNGETYTHTCPTPSMPSTLDVNADFSSAHGTFACFIIGHIHNQVFAKMIAHNNQIVYGNDAAYCWTNNNGYWASAWSLTPRNKDLVTQDLVSVLCVDTDNKMINIVRVGATTTMFGEKYEIINFSYA